MALSNNYGAPHQPILKHTVGRGDRQTVRFPALDSAAFYMGGFVALATGALATPSGAEFGIPTYADDQHIYGFVVGFYSRNGTPVEEDPNKKGTITDATGEIPFKYTFSSTNDESNTTSADLETVEIMPIVPGDILEVSLWGDSTVHADRGTTTAAGTTGSSANFGIGLAVDTTYHFALLESSASKTLADTDFMTVNFGGNYPTKQHRVYVTPTRVFTKLNAPN